jgi:small subunit ribosomal protein S1
VAPSPPPATVIVENDLTDAEFEAALESSVQAMEEGRVIEGVVVKVDPDEVLLDIGWKSEGVIPVRELSIKADVDPKTIVQVGDVVAALIMNREDELGRLVLSKKRAQYEAAWGSIERIYNEDRTVQGTVIEVVKGGLIIDIGLRGFLPASLVEMRRVSATSRRSSVRSSSARSSSSTATATTSSCRAASSSRRRRASSATTSSPR